MDRAWPNCSAAATVSPFSARRLPSSRWLLISCCRSISLIVRYSTLPGTSCRALATASNASSGLPACCSSTACLYSLSAAFLSCLETPGVGFSAATQAKQTDRNRMIKDDLIGKPYCTSQGTFVGGNVAEDCVT